MELFNFKKLMLVLIISMVTFYLVAETLAEPPSNYYEEGAGTEAYPFLISNLANLRWLSETPRYWGSPIFNDGVKNPFYFLQTADIDAYETREWYSGRGFFPIGLHTSLTVQGAESEFYGHYYGDGFKIQKIGRASCRERVSCSV
jgi:hypothetical protein